MTDYKDLIDRLRSMYGHGDIQFNELINRRTGPKAADAMAALVVRVAELEAERAEREKQKPVTTVENRYNADGKSCHITDDLPAGMPLYAAPPVAAPVRPNDSELEMIARAHGTGGWQTLGDMVTFARAIESAVLRANGFKLEGEQ